MPRKVIGGSYSPLSAADLIQIDQAVRKILQQIGLSDAPDIVTERITAAGGKLNSNGRLTFSEALIEDALRGLSRDITLHGQVRT